MTIQLLALMMLAHLRQDLLTISETERAILLTNNLKETFSLTNPSLGKWYGLLREILKAYQPIRERLVLPELFAFWFQESHSDQKLRPQPIHQQVIEPLISLRNDFHHGRLPETQLREQVAQGLDGLHQLLAALQFLAQYELSFTQRITLQQERQTTNYIHDFTLFNGCLYDRDRRTLAMHLQPQALLLLHPLNNKHLVLNPFLAYTEHVHGPDIVLLNTVAKNKAVYVSTQFGVEVSTTDPTWPEGGQHQEALAEFLNMFVSREVSSEARSPRSAVDGVDSEAHSLRSTERENSQNVTPLRSVTDYKQQNVTPLRSVTDYKQPPLSPYNSSTTTTRKTRIFSLAGTTIFACWSTSFITAGC